MSSRKVLPIGYILGNHYEIVRVLEEEETGVLYLVRDVREDSSNRKEMFVPDIDEVEEVVEEVKEEKVIDLPKIESSEEKKSYLFLKILIVAALLLAGLTFYAYKMIKYDKEHPSSATPKVVVKSGEIYHPPLKEREVKKEQEVKEEESQAKEVLQEEASNQRLRADKEIPKPEEVGYVEEDIEVKNDVAVEEVERSGTLHAIVIPDEPTVENEALEPTIEQPYMEQPAYEEESKAISLGVRIGDDNGVAPF